MVLADGATARVRDIKQQGVADFDGTLLNLDQVDEQVTGFFLWCH